MSVIFKLLTHFKPIFHLCNPKKRVTFSGGTEIEYWAKIGLDAAIVLKDNNPINSLCPQNGQTHVKNLAAFAVRFSPYVWSFCGYYTLLD